MRRIIPAAIIAATLVLVTEADAHIVTVPEYTQALEHVYQYRSAGGDYRAFGGSQHGRDRLTRWRAHAKGPIARGVMRRDTRRRKSDWRFHRRIDRITPYGEWAIDPAIVMCESGGNYTEWNNGGSGASGAYQIMGSTWLAYGGGEIASAAAYAPPWAQHLIASRIWAGGSGRSQWAC